MPSPLAIALLIVGAPLCLMSCYLLMLTLAGLFYRLPRTTAPTPRTRFAVLVPAHDEEVLLPRLLKCLSALDYPRSLYEVFVVADNCSDGTAAAAREHGATVLERTDTERRGKGYALRWLLGRLQQAGHRSDAYVFIDADCTVSPNFLSAMDRRFQDGARAAQGYYIASNASQSPAAALRYLAMVLMHHTRPRGRETLGLSCGIFGTGFALAPDVLRQESWDAFTLAEDVEYFLKLTRRGIRVAFVPDAVVLSEMPAELREARSQNLRWEKGRLQMARRQGLRLVAEGLVRLDARSLDAGLQQIIPPLSVTGALSFVLLPLSWLSGAGWLLALNGIGTAALLAHAVLGLWAAKVPGRALISLLHAPAFVLWKVRLYLTAFSPSETAWVRTQRPKQE